MVVEPQSPLAGPSECRPSSEIHLIGCSGELVNTTAAKACASEASAAATAYHLGIPNFKLFLCLRYLLGVWSLFLGLFYEEMFGWTSGLLLLASALAQTAARIRPSLWYQYRGSLMVVDAVVGCLSLLGLISATLVRGLYISILPFTIIQLVLQAVVWPNRQAHPHCFPTYRRRACGSVSTEMIVEKAELKRRRWTLKKAPYFCLWTLTFAAIILMIATTGQRLMIYPGTLFKVRIPEDFSQADGLDVELVSFFTRDQMRLSALFAKPTVEAERNMPEGMPRMTMWIFYGNTGNMVHQVDCVVPLMRAAYPNLQFFIFSYRGYANSDGRPHIAGLRKDIDAAVRYLKRRPDVDLNRILAYGHSIGGALVSDVIGRHPGFLKRVILSNTFRSMHHMADTWHLLLLKPFITEPWDSEAAFARAVSNRSLPPILFMSSRQDGLIPPEHMDKLMEIADGNKHGVKHTKLLLPNGDHNNWGDKEARHRYWTEFFRKAALESSAA